MTPGETRKQDDDVDYFGKGMSYEEALGIVEKEFSVEKEVNVPKHTGGGKLMEKWVVKGYKKTEGNESVPLITVKNPESGQTKDIHVDVLREWQKE
jgi:hypothetical protein